MSEIVIVTWDGGGNVPPALAIGAELQSRGHGIRILGHASQRPVVEAAGFRAVDARQTMDFTAGGTHSTRDLIAAFGDRGAGRDLHAELSRQAADLVLVDALTFGALDAARASGVRYAVLEHFYDGYYQGLLRGPLGLALRAKGLRPGRSLRDAAVRVVTSLPELDVVQPSAAVRQVGPVLTWRPRVVGEPTVLVSLSTFGYAGMRQRLQDALDGCAGLDARVVVTTGPHVDPASLRVPPGVEVHRVVPHDELMPRAGVVVGHGGHGTAMRALAHDAPVVVLPMDPRSDHVTVGRSLEAAGAGRMVRATDGPAAIAAAVQGLLGDGPHRAAAARLGDAVRSAPGAVGAADALEDVLVRGGRTSGR